MAYRYEVLCGAQDEIEAMVAYLDSLTGGSSAARVFMDDFREKIGLICNNPMKFGLSRMPELAVPGYRAFFVKNYVVLYFFREDSIYIAHVFHQRQDYARSI